jgi:hypothetical protein
MRETTLGVRVATALVGLAITLGAGAMLAMFAV